MKKSNSIFTLQFWLLCLSSFLFFSSFNMLIPELPDYLTSLGGAEYKGLIISLFTLTAGLSRPFSGKLTDRIGRVPVMAFGSLVCFVCGFLYPLVTTVLPFLLLRFVHGFSTGFKPTGTAAYIADIVPVTRRGESMGIHGLIGSLGMAFGPAIGSWIALEFSMNVLFYCSSAFSLLSILILVNMKETLPKEHKEKFTLSSIKIGRHDIFDWAVFPVVIVVFFTSFTFGTVATLTPDLSKSIGLENKGFFFLIYTLASLLIRFVAGKWSDQNGRVPVLIIGCIFLVIAMIFTAYSTNVFIFTCAAALYGISMGIISPITQAWTVDLCEDANRGRAIATMYIALEAGIGIGAFFPTLIYHNELKNLPNAILVSVIFALVALVYLLFYRRKEALKVGV
ncbi:MFS transporter [Emticicia sp. CRIBPO]|uniref:MFS transporter n=1 Tax=Emticicia sp. CRIBPO TaxID=2683258 RepID=UPI0014134724|nr:MFS transporter [Emticicia sp. CRIBPO]NBA84553.1 MFS transporter [Emticicia sp. CRIBPO]